MRAARGLALLSVLAFVAVAYAQAPNAPENARRFQNDLIAYAAFQSDVSQLSSMQIASPEQLDAALERAARHNTRALVRGWMNYGANVAAQSPTFVAGVRDAAARLGADALVREIASDRARIRRLDGTEEASRFVLETIAADAERVAYAADRLMEYSNALQRAPWASADAAGQLERVQRLRGAGEPGGYSPSIPISVAAQLTVTPLSVRIGADSTSFGGRRFWDVLNGRGSVLGVSSVRRPPPRDDYGRASVEAMLAVAALKALDAEEAQPSAVDSYLSDRTSMSCVEMARLQFYQCVSAARFNYENGYCLARHGVRDIALCMDPSLRLAPPALIAAQDAAPMRETQDTPEPPEAADAPPPAPRTQQQTSAAPSSADASFLASLESLGPGELFARADELDEEGASSRARAARRLLIARFPDSPLAHVAAQQLARRRPQPQ